MIKHILQSWVALQELLTQVASIRGKTRQDIPTVNTALRLYKQTLLYDISEDKLQRLLKAYALGKIDEELLQ